MHSNCYILQTVNIYKDYFSQFASAYIQLMQHNLSQEAYLHIT